MAFVPFVPTPPRETTSPQAQDLANRIASLIADYQRAHPDLGARDVADALRAAAGEGGSGRSLQERRLLGALFGGVVALVMGAVLFLRQSGEAPWSNVGIVAAVVVAIAVVALARRRS